MKTNALAERKKRHAEFVKLFNRAPGKSRGERITYCANKLLLSEQTIRTYLLSTPSRRFPSALSVQVLADAIEKDQKKPSICK